MLETRVCLLENRPDDRRVRLPFRSVRLHAQVAERRANVDDDVALQRVVCRRNGGAECEDDRACEASHAGILHLVRCCESCWRRSSAAQVRQQLTRGRHFHPRQPRSPPRSVEEKL